MKGSICCKRLRGISPGSGTGVTRLSRSPLRFTLVVLTLLVVAEPALLGQAPDVPTQVGQILASHQSRSGQIQDLLVQLGRPAVPILLEKLDTFAFPMVIVQALGRLGDDRATIPLLNLLNRMEPFARTEGQFYAQRLIVIAALREIGDTRAEPLLRQMFLEEQIFIGTKLAAATALARLGSADIKQQARDFILEIERDARAGKYGSLHVAGPFRPADLDQALFEVGTDESRTILMDRLLQSQIADEELTIINLLARTPSPAVAAALLTFCEKRNAEPYVQFQAAKSLAGLGVTFPRLRLLAVLRNLRNHLAPQFHPDVDKLIQQLTAP